MNSVFNQLTYLSSVFVHSSTSQAAQLPGSHQHAGWGPQFLGGAVGFINGYIYGKNLQKLGYHSYNYG